MISGFWDAVRRPAFVACAVLLAAAASGLEYAARRLDLHFTKLAIPLQTPLRALDRAKLRPYRFVEAAVLTPEVVEELDTDEYIHWLLEDTSRGTEDPTRVASLFVTYYTGQPDPVPHVPDVCYLGGGYQQLGASSHEVEVPELAALGLTTTVPFRILTFGKKGLLDPVRTTVCYTFSANGAILAHREAVRLRLNNWTERYAYFSKLEASFYGTRGQQPSEAEAAEAAKRLFRKVLPVLVSDHWPDWESVTRKPVPQSRPASAARPFGRT